MITLVPVLVELKLKYFKNKFFELLKHVYVVVFIILQGNYTL